jgi:hypothetical protein
MFLSKLVTITKQYGVISQKTAISILISVWLLQRMLLVCLPSLGEGECSYVYQQQSTSHCLRITGLCIGTVCQDWHSASARVLSELPQYAQGYTSAVRHVCSDCQPTHTVIITMPTNCISSSIMCAAVFCHLNLQFLWFPRLLFGVNGLNNKAVYCDSS